MWLRHQNFAAPRLWARSMFSWTFDMGTYIFKSKDNRTLSTSTQKTVKAAFSKSVSWTSIVLSSTRQPMLLSAGGGFHLTLFQFVLCRFSK